MGIVHLLVLLFIPGSWPESCCGTSAMLAHTSFALFRDNNLLGIPEEMVLLIANLDRRATILRDQHAVAGLDTHGHALALLVEETGSDGEDLALVQLLDAGLREEDAAGGLGLGLNALHEDAVQQGDEVLDRSESGRLELVSLSANVRKVSPVGVVSRRCSSSARIAKQATGACRNALP